MKSNNQWPEQNTNETDANKDCFEFTNHVYLANSFLPSLFNA